MQSLQPWCVARVVELLNDASVLYLHSAQRGLRELVHSAVQKCGVAVRRRGVWRVRHEQSGVWKCMTLAYMEALPDIKIMMQTDWSFPCFRELVIFLRQACYTVQTGFRTELCFMLCSWMFTTCRIAGVGQMITSSQARGSL